MDFADWLDNEIKTRNLKHKWIAERATDLPTGEPMHPSYVGYIRNRKRPPTADAVIRITRALKGDFLKTLALAGFITETEAKWKVPDSPSLFGIWNLLNQLDEDGLRKAEPTILSAINRELEEKAAQGRAFRAGAEDAERVKDWEKQKKPQNE